MNKRTYTEKEIERLMKSIFSHEPSEPRAFLSPLEGASAILRCEEEDVLEKAYQLGYHITYIGDGWFSFIPEDV